MFEDKSEWKDVLEEGSPAHSSLLDAIYEAGTSPGQWSCFVEKLGAAIGSGATVVFQSHDHLIGNNSGFLSSNFDKTFIAPYVEYYSSINPWLRAIDSAPIGVTVNDYDALPHKNLVKTEFWADFVRPMDDFSAAVGVVVEKQQDRMLLIGSNFSWKHQSYYRPKIQKLYGSLAPHIQRAFGLQRSLEGRSLSDKTYLSVLDNLSNPVILVDQSGQAVFANAKAKSLLDTKICLRASRFAGIEFFDPSAQQLFSKTIQAIVRGVHSGDESQFVVCGEFESQFLATLVPFRPSAEKTGYFRDFNAKNVPVAMLSIFSPNDRPKNQSRAMSLLYELSDAEGRLISSLQEGLSLKDHADTRQISVNTVRNQLKSIFVKTGVNRQSELIALASRLSN